MRLKTIIITLILGIFLISGSKAFAGYDLSLYTTKVGTVYTFDLRSFTPAWSEYTNFGGSYALCSGTYTTDFFPTDGSCTNVISGNGSPYSFDSSVFSNNFDRTIEGGHYNLSLGVSGWFPLANTNYFLLFWNQPLNNWFYLNLGDITPPNTTSRIISVMPQDTASSTSASPLPYTFSLNTYLSNDDLLSGSTTISYSLINRDQGNILTGNFTATTSGETSYSSSVDIGLPNGFYQGMWSMQLPFSCGNGLDGGCYSPLLSTSTSFVLGYSAIKTINQDYLNASTTPKDCSQFTSATDPNYYLCPLVTSITATIRWLFMPDTASIESVFSLFDILKAKAPLGYFFLLSDAMNGISATSTPVVTYNAPVEIRDNIFTPIRTAFTWLFWFFFAFSFYKILKVTRII